MKNRLVVLIIAISETKVMDHVDSPLAIHSFGELTYKSVVTDHDSIAVLLHSTRSRLEITSFHEFTKALEDVETDRNFHKTFLHT